MRRTRELIRRGRHDRRARRAGAAVLPGDRPELYDKALFRADLVVFDLEDAVAPPAKVAARAGVAAVTAAHPRTSIARINAAGTPWFDDDVAAMRQAGVQRLMLPKAGSPAQLESLAAFEVVALCETAAGVLAAQQLAAAPNCIALMWGGEDLIADTGGRSSRTRQGRYRPMIEMARSSVLLAAAAQGSRQSTPCTSTSPTPPACVARQVKRWRWVSPPKPVSTLPMSSSSGRRFVRMSTKLIGPETFSRLRMSPEVSSGTRTR